MASSNSSIQHTIQMPDCKKVGPTTVSLISLIFSRVKRFIMILSVFVCSIVVAVVALPLLLAAFLVTRVLQFIYGCGYVYDKTTKLKVLIKLKLFLRTWLYLFNLYLMCWVLILFGVAHIPHLGLKNKVVLGYSIMHWIKTYFIIFGICSLSYILSIVSLRFVMYCIPLEYHTFKSGSLVVSDMVHEIIDCFILSLFAEHVIVIHLHFLKEFKLLGFYPTHRLFHVLVILLVFHDLIGLSTHVLVWWLHKLVDNPGSDPDSFRYVIITRFMGRESLVYWANGLKPSIMFTFSTLMLLLTWVLYFGHLIQKHKNELGTIRAMAMKVLRVGTWTTLCLFFYSIFWLIKNCILLELENRIVYKKFGPKISKEGKHLYFLGVLGRGINYSYDFLNLRYDAKSSSSQRLSQTLGDQDSQKSKDNHDRKSGGCLNGIKKTFSCEIAKEPFDKTGFTKGRGVSLLMLSIFPFFLIKEKARYHHPTDPEDNLGEPKPKSRHDVKKLSLERRKQAKEDLLTPEGDTLMLYELQKKVQYFLEAKGTLSKDKYTSQILKYLQRDGTYDGSIEKTLKRLIVDSKIEQNTDDSKEANHDWDSFQKIMDEQVQGPSTKYVERLETWLEEAHNRSVVLANTLSSAEELVECLDTIMSVILVILAFIVWLLLTGLTTTKGIVLIGSPIVSFSFIFGNTCNTFFQGIMFVYAMHPYDVGDLCVIEDNMLEVRTIGVWKTTFSKVDTGEEVIYPNSDLMNKNIINHKTEFDWNENVEIYEDSTNRENIISLTQKIEEVLNDAKYESKPRGTVEVMTTPENKLKIVVNFRYNAKLIQKKSMTYFECLREKRNLRSEFVQKLVFPNEKKNIGEGPNVQETEIQTSHTHRTVTI